MNVQFETIFVHTAATDSDISQRFQHAFPEARVVPVQAESEVRKWLKGPDTKVVYIGPRSSPFVSRFRPPGGMICASFWKFTSETFCPLGCHYCYLSLTLRIIPYVRVASNLDKGLGEVESVLVQQARQEGQPRVMFNIGELADGRVLDPVTHLSRYLLPILDQHPTGMLHVLTKAGSDTIGNYLDLAHLAQGRIIHVASINPQLVIDSTEEGTAPLLDRLAALQRLQQAGYRIRLRIDPILDLRDFGYSEEVAYGVYDELVDQIGDYCRPELITLGSYRPHPQLICHIRRRYPDSLVLKASTYKNGKKRRLEGRQAFYQRVVEQVWAGSPWVRIALCKETLDVWKDVGLDPKPLQCSCLPCYGEHSKWSEGSEVRNECA